MGQGLGASDNSNSDRNSSVFEREANAVRSRHNHKWGSALDRILWGESIDVLKRIFERRQDVNVVFSGATGIGVEQYCEEFAQWTKFRLVKSTSAHKSNLDAIEKLKMTAAGEISKPGNAMIYHTMDVLQKGYIHLEESVRKNATPDVAEQPEFRVFHQSIVDHTSAMAEASKLLGYVTSTESCLLQHVGALLWKLSNVNCSPSNTLYVYVKYTDQIHKAAYGCFLEHAEQQLKEVGSEEETIRTMNKTVASMTPLIEESKRQLDRFYSANVAIENYFSITVDCADSFLLTPRYGITICNKILRVIDQLQDQDIWGAPDDVRLRFLAHPEWKIARTCHIPVAIAIKNTAKKELDRDIKEFEAHNPPFPLASSATIGISQPSSAAAVPTPSDGATERSHIVTIEPLQKSPAAAVTTTTRSYGSMNRPRGGNKNSNPALSRHTDFKAFIEQQQEMTTDGSYQHS